MTFHPTNFEEVWLIELSPHSTPLGYLARSYCEETFRSRRLCTVWTQCNETLTPRQGSLRGMHWQQPPHAEAKLVRCLRGTIFDVVVDVRPGSPTFGRHQSFVLSAENLRQLYIPEGFAHGFQTLTDDCMLHYQMSASFSAESARGFRWDDPAVAISWPLPVTLLSDRDKGLPSLSAVLER